MRQIQAISQVEPARIRAMLWMAANFATLGEHLQVELSADWDMIVAGRAADFRPLDFM